MPVPTMRRPGTINAPRTILPRTPIEPAVALGKTWTLCCGRPVTAFAAATTKYLQPDGYLAGYSNWRTASITAYVDYLWGGLQLPTVPVNTLNTNGFIRSVINGVYGNQLGVIQAGSTAIVWDQNGVDRLHKGDHYCYELSLTGTGSVSISFVESYLTQVRVPGQPDNCWPSGLGAGDATVPISAVITQDNIWGYTGNIGGGATRHAWAYTQQSALRVVHIAGYHLSPNTVNQGGGRVTPEKNSNVCDAPILTPAGFVGQLDQELYSDYQVGDTSEWLSDLYGGASTGSYAAGGAGLSYVTTDGWKLYQAGFSKGPATYLGFPAATTGYLPINGETNPTAAASYNTRANAEVYIYAPTRFRHATVHTPFLSGPKPGNTIDTGTIVCDLLIDGAVSGITMSVAAGNTAEVVDLTHTVDVPTGRHVCWRIVTSGSSGTFGGGFINLEGLPL